MERATVQGLLRQALQAQAEEDRSDRNAKNPALQELLDAPSEEVFATAASLCGSEDRHERLLGVRILRELGRPAMPYRDRTVELLLGLLEAETDSEVLEWTVSALGYQRSSAALPALLRLASHPGPGHLPVGRTGVYDA